MNGQVKPRKKHRPYADYKRWLDAYRSTCARGITDTDLAAICGCSVAVATRWRRECKQEKGIA